MVNITSANSMEMEVSEASAGIDGHGIIQVCTEYYFACMDKVQNEMFLIKAAGSL